MQLAGCMIQKPTRLWARGCGGPELYGKVTSRQTNDNSTTIGLTPAAGIVEGRLEARGLSSQTIGMLRDCFVECLSSFRIAISNTVITSVAHITRMSFFVARGGTWWQFFHYCCIVVCRSPPSKVSKCQIPYPPPKT